MCGYLANRIASDIEPQFQHVRRVWRDNISIGFVRGLEVVGLTMTLYTTGKISHRSVNLRRAAPRSQHKKIEYMACQVARHDCMDEESSLMEIFGVTDLAREARIAREWLNSQFLQLR